MAGPQHKFQAPKGTRDWYPNDLAVRRHIERVWRQVSINHGFEEVSGPAFEHVELYTAKSGPGIVGEIFGVFSGKDEAELEELKRTGRSAYALRPEFTPTLARMFAAQAGSLPRPTRWFCMPDFYRAERPQRGRLREFQQWNVDILGDDSPKADAEVIAVAVAAMEGLGLSSGDLRVRLSHRDSIRRVLVRLEVPEESIPVALELLDRRNKVEPSQFERIWTENRLPEESLHRFNTIANKSYTSPFAFDLSDPELEELGSDFADLVVLEEEIHRLGIGDWCEFDLGIVRGLAYYTGTVFEIIAEGERAVAGGGRYDKLVELFGGPPTPACGFAMGDVVLTNLLRDKGLLKEPEQYLPRPDAFVIAADDGAAVELPKLVASLRRANLHVRHSSKTTRNVGKLLGEAAKSRARFAVILGKELAERRVALKDLQSGDQREVALADLEVTLKGSS